MKKGNVQPLNPRINEKSPRGSIMEKPPQFTQVKAPPLVKSQFNNAIEEDLAHLPYKENVQLDYVSFMNTNKSKRRFNLLQSKLVLTTRLKRTNIYGFLHRYRLVNSLTSLRRW